MATTILPAPQETEIIEELKSERTALKDGRRRRRIHVSLPVHVRPFDTRFAEIEDVGQVQNFTRDGLYFLTCMPHYFKGMRLIVTFPFGDNVSAHRRFLGEVVRLEENQKGTTGIAVKFLL
jgi:hypothetical protein